MIACALLPLLASSPFVIQGSDPAPTPRLDAWARRVEMQASTSTGELPWEALGPKFCGGRIEAVDCPAGDPATIYAGIGAGGVFRSRNGGLTWEPIFDGESTFAVGDLEISAADKNVIWVGTGEAHLSGSSYAGTGVFKSTDGGETWTNTGLFESGHIGKVVAHPTDVERVFVAAMGPMQGGGERGVYRSTDGGGTWERVLHCGDGVSLVDMVMDPSDPERLWATAWRRGGKASSGVFRTTDGGDTWSRLGGGLLEGDPVGRVAIAASASEPGLLYCLMVDHSPEGGGRSGVGGVLMRSTDAGDSWTKTHEDYLPTYVGWDFCDVRVAPDDADQVYVCGFRLLVSEDGGASFERGGEEVLRLHPHAGEGMHLDMHDLWIDPVNPERLLLGNDGGLYVSWDRAKTWLHLNELPIAEFYNVHLEDVPGEQAGFRIWGGTQDNASLLAPSGARYVPGAADEWEHVFLDPWAGGDGFSTFPDPFDPEIVYFAQQLGDLRRGKRGALRGARRIKPKGKDLSFAWNTPFRASPSAEGVLYCAADTVFRSEDRGGTWTSLGPKGQSGAIHTLDESPLDPARLVIGGSSGQLWASTDGGTTWIGAGPGLPMRRVTEALASVHDPRRLLVALAGKGGGDRDAHLLQSDDFGASWTSLSDGLPKEPIQAIVEHPRDPKTLYVGTDLGVFVSVDGGATWEVMGSGLPTVPVMDMAFHGKSNTLVIVTHGRGAFSIQHRLP